jgi:GntR family transcriptional regulator
MRDGPNRVVPLAHAGSAAGPPIRPNAATFNQSEAPKYIRVRDWLMEQILSSGFARGEKLPSESELVRRFDVSRVTVRQALESLRADGVIESRHGKGWFLRRFCAVQNLGRLQGFGEMLAPMGVKVRSKVLEIKECAIPKPVAQAFGLPEDCNVIQIARLRIAGGRVMSYDLSYFPLDIGRRLREQDLSRHDIFVLLERTLGMPLAFADVAIEIAPAEDDPARQLGVKLATPIFKMTRLTHDLRGFPIDSVCLRLAGSYSFKVRVPRR